MRGSVTECRGHCSLRCRLRGRLGPPDPGCGAPVACSVLSLLRHGPGGRGRRHGLRRSDYYGPKRRPAPVHPVDIGRITC